MSSTPADSSNPPPATSEGAQPVQSRQERVDEITRLERERAKEVDPFDMFTTADDYALMCSVAHTSCLAYTFNSYCFSQPFTFKELEARYVMLMFDEKTADRAAERYDELTPEQMIRIQSKIPFTRAEEKCLSDSGEQILRRLQAPSHHTLLDLRHFKQILERHQSIFHAARTPQILSDHYRRLKRHEEGVVQPHPQEDDDELSDEPTDHDDIDEKISVLMQRLSDRHHQIAQIPALRGIQSGFSNVRVPDNAVAVIQGSCIGFAMTGNVVVMGRANQSHGVDIDLSKEGPAIKVSRRQAVICRDEKTGDFTITNIGRRPMAIDSKPVCQNQSTSLEDGSIIRIASLQFTFSIPGPRELHPITQQVAEQQQQAAEEAARQQQQRFYPPYHPQRRNHSKRVRPAQTSSAPRRAAVETMHPVVQRASPNERARLLKALSESF